jgi:hypothetical protein
VHRRPLLVQDQETSCAAPSRPQAASAALGDPSGEAVVGFRKEITQHSVGRGLGLIPG